MVIGLVKKLTMKNTKKPYISMIQRVVSINL